MINTSAGRLLVCCFNAGDNAIPFDATWVDAKGTGELKVGNFVSLSIGMQAQEGGRWIGGDPKDPPYATPGQTLTLIAEKKLS
ncbi:MAG TPA: hypothetical protein VF381_16420 [Thermoanaerobaculia bacterium]